MRRHYSWLWSLGALAWACDRNQHPGASAGPDDAAHVSAQARAPASDPSEPQAGERDSDGATGRTELPVASAQPAELDPLTIDPGSSTSIGSPSHGRLEGGVPVPLSGPGFRFDPRKSADRRFGTLELVAALVKAAASAHQRLPGNTLTFGDIGKPTGGDIGGHGSHQAGRDADVMFYLQHRDGTPADGIPVPLDPKGEGTDYNDLSDPSDDVPLRLDVPRTWAFVEALLGDPDVSVQKIFIVEHLRTLLLSYAKSHGVPKHVVQLFADVTCQPAFPHDDHMHIRVFCSAQDIGKGCRDVAPIYPWQRKRLAEQGIEPVAPEPLRRRKKALKSVAKARADAGPMHPSVVEFLDRRAAWAKRPHPGRRWCK